MGRHGAAVVTWHRAVAYEEPWNLATRRARHAQLDAARREGRAAVGAAAAARAAAAVAAGAAADDEASDELSSDDGFDEAAAAIAKAEG